jgi:hypothetical protein
MSLTRTIAALTIACLSSSWLAVPCWAAPNAKKVKVEAT